MEDLLNIDFGSITRSPVVKVIVGDQDKKADFWVHKCLLESNSEFFNASLRGGFKEAAENTVSLPEDNAEAFSVLVRWMYIGFIRYPEAQDDLLRLMDAYVLADKLLMKACQDAIIDEIGQYVYEYRINLGNLAHLEHLNTSDGNPLRQLFADMFKHEMPNRLIAMRDQKNPDFDRYMAFLDRNPKFASKGMLIPKQRRHRRLQSFWYNQIGVKPRDALSKYHVYHG